MGVSLGTRAARVVAAACALIASFPVATLAAQSSPLPTRWILTYAGGPKRPKYTVDDYVHMISVVDTQGLPLSWLGTGVLYLEVWASSGRAFATWAEHPWANGSDWQTYLDTLFKSGANLTRLDSAVSAVSGRIGSLGSAFPVAVMIPYPDTAIDTLRFGGRLYHPGVPSDRLALVGAWVDSVTTRFRASHYRNLELTGIYWLQEQASHGDVSFLPQVAAAVHEHSLKFLWIPYYMSNGYWRWRELGFDEAWYQPNYFFQLRAGPLRADTAMHVADSLGMGIELEFDGRLISDGRYENRLLPYIIGLWMHPDLRARPVAIYDGAGALLDASRSRDARIHDAYEQLVDALAAPIKKK